MLAFPLISDCLQPDAILVIGSENWKKSPSGGHVVTTIHYAGRTRNVWAVPYPTSNALMTWVYHPRSNLDPPQVGAAIFQQLLALAATHKAAVK